MSGVRVRFAGSVINMPDASSRKCTHRLSYELFMIEITLPWFPPQLTPNNKNGKRWQSTSKIKKKYRNDCYLCSLGNKIDHDGYIALTITFHPPNFRMDLDNCLASIKAGIDGMADALGVNDRKFRPITIDFGDKDKNNPHIKIRASD